MLRQRQNVLALHGIQFLTPVNFQFAGEFDMQIISRSVNEGLVIGNDIRVTILEIQGRKVRLSIETPKQAPFYREEVLDLGDDGGDMLVDQTERKVAREPVVASAAL